MQKKSSVEEIRARFDRDVERFSNLRTGQSAAVDAPLALELIAKAANAVTPNAKDLLDVGCGAGNFSLRVLAGGHYASVTLVDLSRPMLDRAVQRISAVHDAELHPIQADIREIELASETMDIVVAGAVLHHLRDEQQWRDTFRKIFDCLKPGGSFWIFDMVCSSMEAVHQIQRQRYAEYLVDLKHEAYRDEVFAYIAKEDSPAPVVFQLDLLKEVGFSKTDMLHYNTEFSAFGGVK